MLNIYHRKMISYLYNAMCWRIACVQKVRHNIKIKNIKKNKTKEYDTIKEYLYE